MGAMAFPPIQDPKTPTRHQHTNTIAILCLHTLRDTPTNRTLRLRTKTNFGTLPMATTKSGRHHITTLMIRDMIITMLIMDLCNHLLRMLHYPRLVIIQSTRFPGVVEHVYRNTMTEDMIRSHLPHLLT